MTAVAPDTIDLDERRGDPPRLNLFLYQVTPNRGWRNVDLPSRSAVSGERLTNPPLALDLHYLLTAYGQRRLPGRDPARLRDASAARAAGARPRRDPPRARPSPLDVSMLPPAFQALAASDLADQVELIKITPEALSTDEMSRLWSAIQTHYRPSGGLSGVGRADRGHAGPAVSPLPVLSRGTRDPVTHRDRGVVVNPDLLPPLPTLFTAETEFRRPARGWATTVTVSGVRLAGAGHVVRLHAPPVRRAVRAGAHRGRRHRRVGDHPAAQRCRRAERAGRRASCRRACASRRPARPDPRETNAIPLILAPAPVIAADAVLGLPAATVTRGGVPPVVTVTMRSRPQVRPEQSAILPLDTIEADVAPRDRCRPILLVVRVSRQPGGRRALGAPARRRRRQRAARPQRPVAGVRRHAADHGAGMNASIERCRTVRAERALISWAEPRTGNG